MNSEAQQMPDTSRCVFQDKFGRLSKIKDATPFFLILHVTAAEIIMLKKSVATFKPVILNFQEYF